MKRLLVVVMLLAMVALGAERAFATSACFCVGQNRSAGTCGHGGVLGSFQDVRKSIPDNLMKYLLLTQALRDQLASAGKAYDPTSGWACWKD